MTTPTLSLIVPAYNAERTLPRLLASIHKQTLGRDAFEVIIVDDGSTDHTVELAAGDPRIVLLTQVNRGPGAARNRGTRAATGDILVYTDADCVLPSTWLETHLQLHQEHSDLDGLCGGMAPADRLPLGSAVLADHLCSWYGTHDRLPPRTPEYMWSANLSIKRRVFDAGVHWSERRITGEDVDFSLQMADRGMTMRFFPKCRVRHVDRATVNGYLRHQYNWGYHAPFVRGSNPRAKYAFLFQPNPLRVLLCLPAIVVGYSALVVWAWLRSRPLAVLSVLPLVVAGKVAYARGVLNGAKAMARGQSHVVADQRLPEPA